MQFVLFTRVKNLRHLLMSFAISGPVLWYFVGKGGGFCGLGSGGEDEGRFIVFKSYYEVTEMEIE